MLKYHYTTANKTEYLPRSLLSHHSIANSALDIFLQYCHTWGIGIAILSAALKPLTARQNPPGTHHRSSTAHNSQLHVEHVAFCSSVDGYSLRLWILLVPSILLSPLVMGVMASVVPKAAPPAAGSHDIIDKRPRVITKAIAVAGQNYVPLELIPVRVSLSSAPIHHICTLSTCRPC
jgi:hypothetical protein